jgi:hypothetical protein
VVTAPAIDRGEGRAIRQTVVAAVVPGGSRSAGSDIKPGTWHATGDGGGSNQCYYALLNSTNTGDIIDNNNFDGLETVDVSGAHAFPISGPCTCVRDGLTWQRTPDQRRSARAGRPSACRELRR